MAPPNMSDPLQAFLGYNPWVFPELVDPRRDLTYIILGWSIYQIIDCTTILAVKRKKWRSQVYQALALALLLMVVGTIGSAVEYGVTMQVAHDHFRGPAEFINAMVINGCIMLSRWACIYCTVKTVKSSYQGNQIVNSILFIFGLLAVLGSLSFAMVLSQYYQFTYEGYAIWKKTDNMDPVLQKVSTEIIPFLAVVTEARVVGGFAIFGFHILTKLPFLWHIYCSMALLPKDVYKMLAHPSVQRILWSILMAATEGLFTIAYEIRDVTMAMIVYSTLAQINTLMTVAFTGPTAVDGLGPSPLPSPQVTRNTKSGRSLNVTVARVIAQETTLRPSSQTSSRGEMV